VLPDVRQVEVPHVDGNPGVTTWARGNLSSFGAGEEKGGTKKKKRKTEEKQKQHCASMMYISNW
jgi:hypothetical protein